MPCGCDLVSMKVAGAFCDAKAGCPFQARLFGLVVSDWPDATLQATLADAQQGQLSLLGFGACPAVTTTSHARLNSPWPLGLSRGSANRGEPDGPLTARRFATHLRFTSDRPRA